MSASLPSVQPRVYDAFLTTVHTAVQNLSVAPVISGCPNPNLKRSNANPIHWKYCMFQYSTLK